jgi:hypothetical protein
MMGSVKALMILMANNIEPAAAAEMPKTSV